MVKIIISDEPKNEEYRRLINDLITTNEEIPLAKVIFSTSSKNYIAYAKTEITIEDNYIEIGQEIWKEDLLKSENSAWYMVYDHILYSKIENIRYVFD